MVTLLATPRSLEQCIYIAQGDGVAILSMLQESFDASYRLKYSIAEGRAERQLQLQEFEGAKAMTSILLLHSHFVTSPSCTAMSMCREKRGLLLPDHCRVHCPFTRCAQRDR